MVNSRVTSGGEASRLTSNFFMGSAYCAVDGEGRLILPAFVRAPLACRTDACAILVGSHEADPCLVAYDPGQAEALAADCRRRRIAEEGSAPHLHYARARRIFGFLDEIRLESDGGCVLHPLLRRRARIEAAALIVGTGGAFEIWSPQAALEGEDCDLADLAAFHLNLKRAA
jgi:transcriptional regulator MraZ